MDTILALSSAERVRDLKRRINSKVTRVASGHALLKRMADDEPLLVLVDTGLPSLTDGEFLNEVKGALRPAHLVLLQDLATFDPGRLSEMLEGPTGRARVATRARPRAARLRPELHDPETGCIDAKRVADFFGLPQAKLAKILGRSPQSVHKTPHAESLQAGLAPFLRIATALVALFGSARSGKVWLNTPHPDLDNLRPMDLVLRGQGGIVGDLLEDSLLGHPG